MCVIGSGGNVWVDLVSEKLNLYQNDESSYTWVGYGEGMDYAMVADFCGCVEAAAPVPITGYDGLKATEVALAAYESAEAGARVSLPL